MEIGNQIKTLRQRRGITQEDLAQHLGVTPQAVSKWERGAGAPDIEMLPAISAYFGVTIDELFALSDDTRMERIRHMLWDVRYLNLADVENERNFLLEKARREPENGKPHALLAEMENHLAREYHSRAAEYAKESLRRDPKSHDAHSNLCEAMGGKCGDWCEDNHMELIEYYKEFVERNPDYVSGYLWLMDQLIDDGRLAEASAYCDRVEKLDHSYRPLLYRTTIAWFGGNREQAEQYLRRMQTEFPEEWGVWLSLGDFMVRAGRYEEAKAHYRKALEIQPKPRYVDGLDSIAQICQIQGDYAGAIAALEEQLTLNASDWNCTSGETVDELNRKIAKLKQKL